MPKRISPRTPFDNLRPRINGTGPQLRAGKIHQDAAFSAKRLLCLSPMFNHALPYGRIVMSAIDSHAVHAVGQQLLNQ